MAVAFRTQGWAANVFQWIYLNAGLPTMLSVLLWVFPGRPAAVARIATAVLTGLVPLLAFLMLRGAVSLPVRAAAALLLAAWPGQIAFSGVVAQDNWVIAPVVAAVCLAVRALAGRAAHPLAAAVVYAVAVWMRQEMLVALLPAVLVAVVGQRDGAGRRLATFAAIAAIFIGAIVVQRGRATGRFRLTTFHGARTLAGSYAPGAALQWSDPTPFLTALGTNPDAPDERVTLAALTAEVESHPVFHAVHRSAALANSWLHADTEDLYWSLDASGVQPRPARGRRVAARLRPILDATQLALHAAFVAAILLAFRSPRRSILAVIGGVILLKFAVHLLIVSAGRFVVPIEALEALMVALVLPDVSARPRRAAAAAVAGIAVVSMLDLSLPLAEGWILRHEVIPQRTYRFTLRDRPGKGELRCVVDAGWVSALGAGNARLELLRPIRRPETARAACRTAGAFDPGEMLEIDGTGSPESAGFSERTLIDGREVRGPRQDGNSSTWISLSDPGGTPASIEIGIALAPDGVRSPSAAPAGIDFRITHPRGEAGS